jgi:hypothetical protein
MSPNTCSKCGEVNDREYHAMAKQLPPIVDYYGTQIEVGLRTQAAVSPVYLGRTTTEPYPATRFDHLTPDQARDLANRLNQAADEIEGGSS